MFTTPYPPTDLPTTIAWRRARSGQALVGRPSRGRRGKRKAADALSKPEPSGDPDFTANRPAFRGGGNRPLVSWKAGVGSSARSCHRGDRAWTRQPVTRPARVGREGPGSRSTPHLRKGPVARTHASRHA